MTKNPPSLPDRLSVCLVTEELAGVGGSGGIGAAFYELALLLASSGALVDVLFCPAMPLLDEEKQRLQREFSAKAIKLSFLDETRYVDGASSYEKRSYAVFRHLEQAKRYHFIHFHDYKGLGFFSINAKRQGLALASSLLVVQLHGPTRWTIEANKAFFVHEDQLKIDHLERVCIANADYVISPSAYLVQWLRDFDFDLPADDRVRVIKNVCSQIVREMGQGRIGVSDEERGAVTDLVMFARHEDRKGFSIFCDALDLLNRFLAGRSVSVSFLGKFGHIDSQPSGAYLIDRSKKWSFNCKVRTGFDRSGVSKYLASLPSPLLVVPSPFENSPYTVLETAAMGLPLISSVEGGGLELIESGYPGLCEMSAETLAAKIRWSIENALAPPALAQQLTQIEAQWLQFHSLRAELAEPITPALPKVAFAITHHERPAKLIEAIISAARQSYPNLDIIVVDDGSRDDATIAALEQMEAFLARIGGRLIRRANGYLGAARNTALAVTDAEFICFLDDDDYASPLLVETLVKAALATGADVVNCMNCFMPEVHRADMIARMGEEMKVSYVPIGGPLSIAVSENCLGAATALIRVSALRAIGGYTELKGVGHEDYELFLRMLQAGMRLEIVPRPLYFYEVGRPSMLSRTSMVRNFRRCFDASDIRGDRFASRDLVSLTIGKKVAVDAHNRQWWLYSLNQNAELRHALMRGGSREEMLKTLVELAQADGNLRMAMAFAEDLHSSYASTDEEYVHDVLGATKAASPIAPRKMYDPRLADIRLEVALSRNDQALEALIEYAGGERTLDEEFYPVAREVLKHSDSRRHAPRYLELATILAAKRVPKRLETEARILLVALEYVSGRDIPVNALRDVVASDEAVYLAMHADVAEAVDAGLIKRGAEHYAVFGSKEGRRGFDGISRIALMLRDFKVDVGADDLLEVACRA
jgi:glycosyltransferase involved in cell wall biosynthesis